MMKKILLITCFAILVAGLSAPSCFASARTADADHELASFYYNCKFELLDTTILRAFSDGRGSSSHHVLRGHAFRSSGDTASAAAAYREALKADPGDERAAYYLAYTCYLSGNAPAASKVIEGFRRGSSGISPAFSDEFAFLEAMIDYDLGKLEKVCESVSSVSASFPGRPLMLSMAAAACERLGRSARAHEYHIDACSADPAAVEHMIPAAPFMAKVGDLANAVKYYGALAGRFGDDRFKNSLASVRAVYEKTRAREKGDQKKILEPPKVEPLADIRGEAREIRVGLNSKADGSPRELGQVKLRFSSGFTVAPEKGGKCLYRGKARTDYELLAGPAGITIRQAGEQRQTRLAASGMVIAGESAGDTVLVRGVKVGSGSVWEGSEARCYRGALIVNPVRGGKSFHLINRIRLEEYLLSVLPSEMPSRYHAEALAAQAVCCRSEALHKKQHIRKHARYGYDLCDDQDCQMYRGVLWETPATTAAVAGTAGKVLTHNGRICDAIYSDNCGGVTQSSSDITGWGNISYLSSRPDVVMRNARHSDVCDPVFMEDFVRDHGSANCAPCDVVKPYESRWLRKVDASIVDRYAKGLGVGRVLRIIPRKRSFSGHLDAVEIVGTAGRRTVTKELSIRRLLSYSPLRSSKVVIDAVRGADGYPRSFLIWGAGFGHGVGLCQNGAHGMACAGEGHAAILSHYFRDARLEKIY